MTEKTWTGATSTSWNTDGNWSPSGVPVADDDILFDSDISNVDCVLDVAGSYYPEFNSFVVDGYTGTITNDTNNHYIFLHGNLTLNFGTGGALISTAPAKINIIFVNTTGVDKTAYISSNVDFTEIQFALTDYNSLTTDVANANMTVIQNSDLNDIYFLGLYGYEDQNNTLTWDMNGYDLDVPYSGVYMDNYARYYYPSCTAQVKFYQRTGTITAPGITAHINYNGTIAPEVSTSTEIHDSVVFLRNLLLSNMTDPSSGTRPSISKFVMTSFPERNVFYPLITVEHSGESDELLGIADSKSKRKDMQFTITIYSKNTKQRDTIYDNLYNTLRTLTTGTSGTIYNGLHDFKILGSSNEDEEGKEGIHKKTVSVGYKYYT